MTYYNVDSQPGQGQYGQGFYNNNQSTASMMSIPDYNDKYTTGAYGSGYAGGQHSRSVPWYKSNWFKIGAGILVLAGIGGGIAAYFLTKDDSPTRPSSSRSTASVQNDPNLHVSFPGMCYSPPYSSFYPNCGDTIEGVEVDVQLLAQLTKVVRLYGSDCNTSALVLDAIQRTGVDLSVFLGIYIDEDPTIYERQVAVVIDALQTFGTDNVQGIISGNEYILVQQTANGAAGAAAAEALVISNMADVRSKVEALNLPKTIPVGFADAGSLITAELARGADFVMANVHPFFSGVGIDLAAGWTWNYLETDAPSTAKAAANNPPVYAAEVGWPGGAFNNGSLTLNGSEASMDNMQVFLDSYACQANTNSTPYFWFEMFDEEWKGTQYGGAESFWGLFNSDRTLKEGIKIPDCEPPAFD